MRVLDGRDSPALKVRAPERGEDRQSCYLFPREAMTLLACEEVPFRWRAVYALALYTSLRAGDQAVLRVGDVVFEGDCIAVHRARDRTTGGTKSTKGKRARRVPIEPNLLPLLVALTEGRHPDELLVDDAAKAEDGRRASHAPCPRRCHARGAVRERRRSPTAVVPRSAAHVRGVARADRSARAEDSVEARATKRKPWGMATSASPSGLFLGAWVSHPSFPPKRS